MEGHAAVDGQPRDGLPALVAFSFSRGAFRRGKSGFRRVDFRLQGLLVNRLPKAVEDVAYGFLTIANDPARGCRIHRIDHLIQRLLELSQQSLSKRSTIDLRKFLIHDSLQDSVSDKLPKLYRLRRQRAIGICRTRQTLAQTLSESARLTGDGTRE